MSWFGRMAVDASWAEHERELEKEQRMPTRQSEIVKAVRTLEQARARREKLAVRVAELDKTIADLVVAVQNLVAPPA